MKWPFDPIWKDKDVYILGGGPSLAMFPFAFLKNEKVIGCNDAYLLGESIVDIVIFGDNKWYLHHKEHGNILNFKNPVITNHIDMKDVSGVIWTPRRTSGFHKDAIGWNGNTGSAAINLALILGAAKIYLVGFDMKLSAKGKSSWHDNPLDNPTAEHYRRYKDAMAETVSQIEKNWPGVEIVNLNPDSNWDLFPKKEPKQVLEKLGYV